VNGQMPHYTVEKVARRSTGAGRRSTAQGAGAGRCVQEGHQRRPRVAGPRHPAAPGEKGGAPVVLRPYVAEVREAGWRSTHRRFPRDAEGGDCVVIVTNHAAFDYKMVARESKMIVDTRNALKGHNGRKIIKL